MDELEHSGVKGMKWGVRKARNAVTSLNIANRNRDLNISATHMGVKLAAAKIGERVSGDGLSTARTVVGTGLHKYAVNKGTAKLTNKANILNFKNNKAAIKAIKRNAKTTAKLKQAHAKAIGIKKVKAKQQLDAWNAYNKKYTKKLMSNLSNGNSAFSTVDSHRKSIDRARNKTINKINNKIYGDNKHGDTNQVLDSQYKDAKKVYNAGKKAVKAVTPEQVRNGVAIAGYVAGRGSRSAVDGANYVAATARRRKVKPAYKDQSTRYKTI